MADPWDIQRWAFATQTGSATGKAVLMALAVMADMNTGRCEAKQETIAKWVETSDRTVRHWLKELEARGIIAKRRQYRIDGGRRGDEFLLLAPGIVEWPDGMKVAPPPEAASGNPPEDDVPPGSTLPPPPGSTLPGKNNHSRKNDHGVRSKDLTPEQKTRAGVPEDFPDALRPHAREVMRALNECAARHHLKPVGAYELAATIMGRPYKPLVRSAYDWIAWYESTGIKRGRKRVLAGYRAWLDGQADGPGYEELDEKGGPRKKAPLRLAPQITGSSTVNKEHLLAEQRERVAGYMAAGKLDGLFPGRTA